MTTTTETLVPVRYGEHLHRILITEETTNCIFQCRRCKALRTVVYNRTLVGYNLVRQNGQEWADYQDDTQPAALVCVKCGGRERAVLVNRTRKTDHECNDKCMSSIRGVCECSCGGKNHGRTYV